MMPIAGRTFLVTGGAAGLGLATARRLVAGGANVALVDLAEAQGQAAAAELAPRAAFQAADVTDQQQMTAAIASAESLWGPLSGAVCCAGVLASARLVGRTGPHPLELFEQVVRTNLIGTFNTLRLVAAAMVRQPLANASERGALVTVASIAGSEGQIGQAAYAAAKGGIAAMTLPLARELARHAIRVVSIAPGVFQTPMTDGLSPESRQALVAQTVFPARLGLPEEFAQLVQQILENPMLNGSVLRLDGAVRLAAQ